MPGPLRALIVEDSEEDALLLLRELRRGDFEIEHRRVETSEGLLDALEGEWDIVFADYTMPGFSGLHALEMVREHARDVPFLFVSGTIGEDRAVQAMKAGADDYFLKDDLHRLIPAVERELRDAADRRERREIEARRREAERALRLSEERHRLLFRHIADAILVFDEDGVVRFASESLEEVLGLDPAALEGRSSLDLVHPEDAELATTAFTRSTRHPNALETVEVRWRHVDDSWRSLECVLRNLLHRPGIEGVVLTCRDVTERRRLEAEFRQAQKLESVGRLAGGIAHDFNNLLTAILAHADFLLTGGGLEPAQRDDLEEIRRAGERAARLTRQLLAFSRRQVLDLRAIDVTKVVEELAPMLRRLIGEDIVIETILERDLHAVRADVSQLEQVIVNLVVNSSDAMPEGGRLTIRTSNEEIVDEPASDEVPDLAPGSFMRLTVEDTGHGMDAATRAQVFDPFYTTKPEGQGTGLGLATVYGIITQLGGHVSVWSREGQGTRIDVRLPRTSEPVRSGHEKPDSPARGTETVLVVEDERGVRQVAARALRTFGYRVIEAGGAESVTALLDEGTDFDLLLTDVVLPGRSGSDIAEEVRRRRPGLAVLFMSGYAAPTLGRRGIADGRETLIDKPFTGEALARKVREVLDQPSP